MSTAFTNGEVRPISVQSTVAPGSYNIYSPQKENRASISSVNINSNGAFEISLYRYTALTNKKVLLYTFSLSAGSIIDDSTAYHLIEGDFFFLVVNSGIVNYSIEGQEYQKNCLNPPFGSGGTVNIVSPGGTSFDGLTNAELRAEPVPISGTVTVDTSLLATKAKQDSLLAELQLKADLTETQPVSLASVPLASNAATSTKQDEQTVLITTLNSLIETNNYLINLLSPLASAMNSGQPALRVVQAIAPPTTPVSGTVTATVASTVVSSLTNFGTGIPAKEMADDINNLVVTMANINNVTV